MSQSTDKGQWAWLQKDMDRSNLASVPLFPSAHAEQYFGDRDPLGAGDAVRGAKMYLEMLTHMDDASTKRHGHRMARKWYQRELDARALLRTEDRLGELDTAYNKARAEKAAIEALEDKRPGMERFVPVEVYRITEKAQRDAQVDQLQTEAGRLKLFLKTMEDEEKSDDLDVERDDDSLFNDSMFEEPPSQFGDGPAGSSDKWREFERQARIAQGLDVFEDLAEESDDVSRGRRGKGKGKAREG